MDATETSKKKSTRVNTNTFLALRKAGASEELALVIASEIADAIAQLRSELKAEIKREMSS